MLQPPSKYVSSVQFKSVVSHAVTLGRIQYFHWGGGGGGQQKTVCPLNITSAEPNSLSAGVHAEDHLRAMEALGLF